MRPYEFYPGETVRRKVKKKPGPATDAYISALGALGIGVWYLANPAFTYLNDIFYGIYGELAAGSLCALLAWRKGRNPFAWFALGVWFSIMALIYLLATHRLARALCAHCKGELDMRSMVCLGCGRPAGAEPPSGPEAR